MIYPKTARTEVFINGNNSISISQPDEECASCGNDQTMLIVLSADAALSIAKYLRILAKQLKAAEKIEQEENHGE